LRRVLLLLFFAWAFSSPIRITVGDPFFLTFREEVKLPAVFEVLGKEKTPAGIKYRVTVFRPGNYMIKSQEGVLYVEVVSVLKDGEELRDIAGPLEVSGEPGWLLLRLGMLLGVGLLLVGGVLLYRRVSLRRRDPWRRLLGEALSLRRELPPLDLDDFYSRLGHILRVYLQRRTGLPALAMTSGELAGRVSPEIHSVLMRADLVRFAGRAASDPGADLSLVLNLIQEAVREAGKA